MQLERWIFCATFGYFVKREEPFYQPLSASLMVQVAEMKLKTEKVAIDIVYTSMPVRCFIWNVWRRPTQLVNDMYRIMYKFCHLICGSSKFVTFRCWYLTRHWLVIFSATFVTCCKYCGESSRQRELCRGAGTPLIEQIKNELLHSGVLGLMLCGCCGYLVSCFHGLSFSTWACRNLLWSSSMWYPFKQWWIVSSSSWWFLKLTLRYLNQRPLSG